MRASIGSARCELGFAVELVGDGVVVGHLAGVDGGGFGEDGIETKRRKALIGACFVGGREEILFGDSQAIFRPEGTLGVEIGSQ